MKRLNNIEKGAKGERYTARYLKRRGYRIVARNMRNRFGEIDIIAENKEYIVFVEVKSRGNDQPVRPSSAVNIKKQQRIMQAAKYYLSYTYPCSKQPRFDVAEVYFNERYKIENINYLENAFIQGGSYAVF